MTEDSLWVPILAMGLFFLALLVERLLLWRQVTAYFVASMPLGAQPVALPHLPEGEGHTASVRWVIRDHRVLFWSDPKRRAGLALLHGVIELHPGPTGVALAVRWAPPWSYLLAAGWLIGLGTLRGEGAFTLPIGGAMILGVLVLYRQAAQRAAAEIRWALVQAESSGNSVEA